MPPPEKPRELFVQLVVSYPENQRVRRLARYGRDARACSDLYVKMMLYCKRATSDGHVPLEEVGVLAYPDSAKIGVRDADRLVAVGLAEKTDDGYFLPGYIERNPTRAEVSARSAELAEAGSESGSFGNHRRWHVRRGITKPDCPHCNLSGAPDNPDRVTPTEPVGAPRGTPEGSLSGIDRSENREQRTENRSTSVALETDGSVPRPNRVTPTDQPRRPTPPTMNGRTADALTVAERLRVQGR